MVWVTASARAQTLQKLTVQSFDLSADTAKPALEVPFHLIVRVHVRERVASIDNLELPILAELELLGDTREVVAGSGGTDYRETITVVAHHTGKISIAPATLQAVDARDGKPKQYFSNPLTIFVGGGSLEPLAQSEHFAGRAVRWFAWVAVWIGGVICAVAIVLLVFHHRPVKTAPVIAAAPPTPAPAPRSRRQQLSDALTVLRAERNRSAAVTVRGVVWRMIGASDGETLADVLRRPQAAEPHMRDVLRSLERAAFTYDADLAAAIDDACASLAAAVD
jgi:hypothetical protein